MSLKAVFSDLNIQTCSEMRESWGVPSPDLENHQRSFRNTVRKVSRSILPRTRQLFSLVIKCELNRDPQTLVKVVKRPPPNIYPTFRRSSIRPFRRRSLIAPTSFRPGFVFVQNYSRRRMRRRSFSAVVFSLCPLFKDSSSALFLFVYFRFFFFRSRHVRPWKSGLFFLHIDGCMKITCLQTWIDHVLSLFRDCLYFHHVEQMIRRSSPSLSVHLFV